MIGYLKGLGIIAASAAVSITLIRCFAYLLTVAWDKDKTVFVALVIGILWFILMLYVMLKPSTIEVEDQ